MVHQTKGNIMSNPDHIDAPDPTRPDLSPVDPRGGFKNNPDVDIHGSIDNESCFNLATGKSTPSRF